MANATSFLKNLGTIAGTELELVNCLMANATSVLKNLGTIT
jgi:hypothetical protein